MFDTFIRSHVKEPLRRESQATGVSTSYTETKTKTPWTSGGIKPSQLRNLAHKSSAVRPAKDGIIREITNLQWQVSAVDKDADVTPEMQKRIDEVSALFMRPNENAKPFAYLLTNVLDDLLTLDKLAIEVVYGRNKKVVELWERDAATIFPKIDKKGVWTGYEQKVMNELGVADDKKSIPFERNQIIFASMFPKPHRPCGTPIIETIIDEIVSLIFSMGHVGKQFTEDEIPPGILWLGEGMSREIWSRVQASLKQGHNRVNEDTNLRILAGGNSPPHWIELKRSNKDMEMRELRKDIEDIIWLNFGVLPARMGRTDSVNRSNIEQQARWNDSALIIPIVNLLSTTLTTGVIQHGFGYEDIKFELVFDREEDQKDLAEIAQKLGGAVPFFSINAVRDKVFNEPPLDFPAADSPFMMTPLGAVFLQDLAPGTLPKEPEQTAPAPSDNTDVAAYFPDFDVIATRTDTSYWMDTAEAIRDMKAMPMVERARSDKFEQSHYDALAERYARTLEAAWDEAEEKIVRSVRGKARLVRDVEVEDEDATREAILIILAGLATQMTGAARVAFSLAANIARRDAVLVDGGAVLTDEQMAQIVNEGIQENAGFVKGSLLASLISGVRDTIGGIYADTDDLGAAVQKAFEKQRRRIIRYANAVRATGAKVWTRAVDVTGLYQYEWIFVNDEASCDACRSAYQGSPYLTRNELPFFPGNSSTCNTNCRCELRTVRRQ